MNIIIYLKNKMVTVPFVESVIKYKLAVDHCHKTGKIRGLLCGGCNTSIGSFEDNPELLKNAIKYLS